MSVKYESTGCGCSRECQAGSVLGSEGHTSDVLVSLT